MLKYQTRSRGQALVETAVVAPLIVLTLAGTLYAARTAIVRERLQIGARYSGLLLSYGDTYSDFSTYALDSARNGSTAPPQPCASPLAATVNATDHTGGMSAAFYNLDVNHYTSSCNVGLSGSAVTDFITIQNAKYTYGTVLLSRNYLSETAQLGRNPFLNVPSSYKVAQSYLRTPTLPVLMRCYPDLRSAITLTTQAITDTTTPSTTVTPLPDVLPLNAPRLDAACTPGTTQAN